jgi:hypothetical protein
LRATSLSDRRFKRLVSAWAKWPSHAFSAFELLCPFSVVKLTFPLQPRRPIVAPADVGCKRLFGCLL